MQPRSPWHQWPPTEKLNHHCTRCFYRNCWPEHMESPCWSMAACRLNPWGLSIMCTPIGMAHLFLVILLFIYLNRWITTIRHFGGHKVWLNSICQMLFMHRKQDACSLCPCKFYCISLISDIAICIFDHNTTHESFIKIAILAYVWCQAISSKSKYQIRVILFCFTNTAYVVPVVHLLASRDTQKRPAALTHCRICHIMEDTNIAHAICCVK